MAASNASGLDQLHAEEGWTSGFNDHCLPLKRVLVGANERPERENDPAVYRTPRGCGADPPQG